MIILAAAYEATDPTIDSQVIAMQAAGADVFVNTAIPKFAAQAIRKAAEIQWKPLHILSAVGAFVALTLRPAGLENAIGIISDFYLKDPTDPQWANDAGMKDFLTFMSKDFPDGNKLDASTVVGYSVTQTLLQVLKQCGDDLTRENIMKQAASLKDFRLGLLLPGSLINTSPTDYRVIQYMKLQRFNGRSWDFVD